MKSREEIEKVLILVLVEVPIGASFLVLSKTAAENVLILVLVEVPIGVVINLSEWHGNLES